MERLYQIQIAEQPLDKKNAIKLQQIPLVIMLRDILGVDAWNDQLYGKLQLELKDFIQQLEERNGIHLKQDVLISLVKQLHNFFNLTFDLNHNMVEYLVNNNLAGCMKPPNPSQQRKHQTSYFCGFCSYITCKMPIFTSNYQLFNRIFWIKMCFRFPTCQNVLQGWSCERYLTTKYQIFMVIDNPQILTAHQLDKVIHAFKLIIVFIIKTSKVKMWRYIQNELTFVKTHLLKIGQYHKVLLVICIAKTI